MAEDIRMMEPIGQPFAFEYMPLARPLTINDLVNIRDALGRFESALRKNDSGTDKTSPGGEESSKRDEGPGPKSAVHCLIVTGYLGKGYKLQADGKVVEKSTEEAVAFACEGHLRRQVKDAGTNEGKAKADSATAAEGYYPIQPLMDRIHVSLESSGGSLDSAYRVALFLRKFAKDVRIYVPSRAKSAATLIAIGADRVVMSPYAELGPLDTQIPDPRNPATFVSALDCYQSVDYVRDFGAESISRALKVMLDRTQKLIPLAQLIDSATDFAIGNVQPMLAQVMALDFGAWGRTLKIGETYAKALRLRIRNPETEENARKLAANLVYGYPHHPYPIDLEEAQSLGITVDMMPKDVYDAAKAIAEACREESRFIGFAEDVQAAIDLLEKENCRTLAESRAANGHRFAQAIDPVDSAKLCKSGTGGQVDHGNQ